MAFIDILSINSYQELLSAIAELSKNYVKNGENIYYKEGEVEKKVEDIFEKKKILSIINLYLLVNKMKDNGVSIEEINKQLREKTIQANVLNEINEKYKTETAEADLYGFALRILRKYEEMESNNRQAKAYQLLREGYSAKEAIRIIRSQVYSSGATINTDIVYILKQAQLLNLKGEEKDYLRDLLYNPDFVEKLKKLYSQTNGDEEKINWEFSKNGWESAKKIAERNKDLTLWTQRDNQMANAYINDEAKNLNRDKNFIILYNNRTIINPETLGTRKKIVFLDRPKEGHVALIRILLKRNGYFMEPKEEDGKYIIEVTPVSFSDKPNVDVEPPN